MIIIMLTFHAKSFKMQLLYLSEQNCMIIKRVVIKSFIFLPIKKFKFKSI